MVQENCSRCRSCGLVVGSLHAPPTPSHTATLFLLAAHLTCPPKHSSCNPSAGTTWRSATCWSSSRTAACGCRSRHCWAKQRSWAERRCWLSGAAGLSSLVLCPVLATLQCAFRLTSCTRQLLQHPLHLFRHPLHPPDQQQQLLACQLLSRSAFPHPAPAAPLASMPRSAGLLIV